MRGKRLAILALPFLFTALLSAGSAPPPKNPLLDKYAAKIAAQLPNGWAVRINEAGDGLWLERKTQVPMNNIAPNGPGNPKPQMGTPTLLLRAGPAVSEADIVAMAKYNASRAKALDMLKTQMEGMGSTMPSGEDDGYAPRNPEQQARLNAYIAVKKTLPEKEIPELFAPDASFYWWDHFYQVPADPAVQKEMDDIRQKVESAFSKKPLQ